MTENNSFVHLSGVDSIRGFLREGYAFIENRVNWYKTSIFQVDFLGQKVVIISGDEAARLIFDTTYFKRQGSVPLRVQKTLFGVNGTHVQDGEEHLHRKHFFMSLMTEDAEEQIYTLTKKMWGKHLTKMNNTTEFNLLSESKKLLTQVACQWTGVPISDVDVRERAQDIFSMIDGSGAVGPRYWKGKKSRVKCEAWIKDVIDAVRSGSLQIKEESPLSKLAFFKNLDGDLYDTQSAAIELLNLLRPTVAVSYYNTFLALALHHYPNHKEKLQSDNDYKEMFIQEIRRYYPLIPVLGARVRENFKWKNYNFKKDMLVLIDVYGTNHDKRIWDSPNLFDPERFRNWDGDLYNLIPQGGGDQATGHRCPAEGITVKIMRATLDFLVNDIEYDVPKQNLDFSMSRMPTFPESGFILSNIKQNGKTH